MVKKVIKRDGRKQIYNVEKVESALRAAFSAKNYPLPEEILGTILQKIEDLFVAREEVTVEKIQDIVENVLMGSEYKDIAKAYILYREKHKDMRLIEERVRYINDYMSSGDNAATASETDANANVAIKNVANIDGEVYKTLNRQIQRYRMRKKLEELYPEIASQYEKDLEHHIIYTHDEASAPTVKNYCEAVTLYPMLLGNSKIMDGIGTTAPHGLGSFCGQLVNLTFLLAAQCKGAVAFGEFFNFFDYFCVKDFGEDYHLRIDELCSTKPKRTIKAAIHQAYQQIIYGWNQPAGNRSYQSPFTNISYYDSNYWHALFDEFTFPDGTKPSWDRVSFLQKDFMQWFNKERTKAMLTFPVETMALLSDGADIIDKDYKSFTNEMYSKGHSFFTYISDNPNALASCCRLRNKIGENSFTFTNGLTGVQTGSANVITLNLNRIVQDWNRVVWSEEKPFSWNIDEYGDSFRGYLINILDRVYKYHIAYKTLLYEVEKAGMLNASKAGYIKMNKLYSTVGLNGINEAAEFLGMECTNNEEYRAFCRLITGTISEQNKKHGTQKFQFNTEFVPAEGLSSKNYQWDRADGYWVPEDRNLYNSYFFKQSDSNVNILEKIRMHGREFTELLDGGVGCHLNLEDHLTREQYNKLMDWAIKVGCTYYTFNIPNSECTNDGCGYIVKRPLDVCPKCGSPMRQWTRVIGYLRSVENFDKERRKEAMTRIYASKESIKI